MTDTRDLIYCDGMPSMAGCSNGRLGKQKPRRRPTVDRRSGWTYTTHAGEKWPGYCSLSFCPSCSAFCAATWGPDWWFG